jgi:hypothetical protein
VKISDVPFTVTDWSKVPATEHKGATGTAQWRTIEQGNIRVRMVYYTPGYQADHWCTRGHVLFVITGELVTELQNGGEVLLKPGMSYQVGEGGAAHRSRTKSGAMLFIVD